VKAVLVAGVLLACSGCAGGSAPGQVPLAARIINSLALDPTTICAAVVWTDTVAWGLVIHHTSIWLGRTNRSTGNVQCDPEGVRVFAKPEDLEEQF